MTTSTPGTLLPLPVTAVTCLEDRAQVERTTVLDLKAGVQRFRLGPVTALTVDRTLHAELTADHTANVLDARIVRTWTPRGPMPDAAGDSALRGRVHALTEEQRTLSLRRDRLLSRRDLLDGLASDLLRDIAEATGSGDTDAPRWTREMDRVDDERGVCGEELRFVDSRLSALDDELNLVQQSLLVAETEPPELLGHVELTVESSSAGPADLLLSHLVPCALWRPAYRAALGDGSLSLETDAMVWQRTGEDWNGVRLTLSTARSALAGDPPRLREDRLTLVDRSPEERRSVQVELREEEVGAIRGASPTGLPGVDDGGEAQVLRAPSGVSVRSDGRAHRVPLSAFTTTERSEYACSPELSPLITQVARFDNRSGHALLAGPVDLVRGSGSAGRGRLDFTAPGAGVELAFGSCDDHRVARHIEEKRDTTGITQRTVITRTVTLYLSRFSAPGEQGDRVIALRERLPVSEVSAVEVSLRKEACSPRPESVDAEGIVRWEISLPPGGRRTVTLVYDISAGGKVTGL
ncbi:DUF4139 domain-containing protein [Streptomyces sp. NPDC051840]|uniref:DUF4139 domain-containing protein n=1 Tax=Streptomyces sp. NPDC051840 TaxID=3154752 RepID=UPI0034186F73